MHFKRPCTRCEEDFRPETKASKLCEKCHTKALAYSSKKEQCLKNSQEK